MLKYFINTFHSYQPNSFTNSTILLPHKPTLLLLVLRPLIWLLLHIKFPCNQSNFIRSQSQGIFPCPSFHLNQLYFHFIVPRFIRLVLPPLPPISLAENLNLYIARELLAHLGHQVPLTQFTLAQVIEFRILDSIFSPLSCIFFSWCTRANC